LDLCVIAAGFVIRIFVGSLATGVPLSMWIVLLTFLLALFLALAKRRNDVLLFLETGKKARRSIDGYDLDILNGLMVLMSAVTIVSYILYTISPAVTSYFHTNKIYFTVFFVILGIMRYMQISFMENKGDSPSEAVLSDRIIQFCLAGWILTFAALIYFHPHF
jgi:4-hydroxybenzoate polyprenyltransferase